MAITNGHHYCLFCKLKFVQIRPWQKYCTIKCQYTDSNNQKKRGQTNFGNCSRCNASLENKRSNAIYCSKTCKSMDHTFKHRSKTRVLQTARRRELWDRDKGTCYLCNKQVSIREFELDHLIPVSRNGDNSAQNLAVCCMFCNRSRGTKLGIRQLEKLFELRLLSEHH